MTPRHVAALIWFDRWAMAELTHKMAPEEANYWHKIRDEAMEEGDALRGLPTVPIQFPPGLTAIAGMILAAAMFQQFMEKIREDKLEIEKAPRRVQYEERRKRQ